MAQSTNDINIRLNVLGEQGLKSIKDYREEIKLLDKSMQSAAASGDNVQFDKLAARMGEIKEDMGDLRQEMKYLDPGNLILGFTKLAQGMVGSFGAVTGILDLVGVKNEELQEIQKKSMVIIQVLTSLESARSLIEGKGLIQGLAGQAKRLVMMGAVKAGMISEIAVTEGATIAQLKLNAAVLANPYVLAAAAIIALVAALAYFVTSENAAEEAARNATIAQDNYNASIKETIAIGADAREGLEQSIDKYNLLTGAITETDNAIESIIEKYKKEQAAMIESTTSAVLNFDTKQKAEREAFADSRSMSETTGAWIKRRDAFEKQQAKELAEFRKTSSKNFIDLKKKEQQDIDNIKVGEVKDTYDKQKANTQKIQSFEEGVSKSISNLRVSLIKDEYEQKKAAINLSYKDDEKNLNQLKDENVKLNDIYTGQKASIASMIKSKRELFIQSQGELIKTQEVYDKQKAIFTAQGKGGVELSLMLEKEAVQVQLVTAKVNELKSGFEGAVAMEAGINLEQEKGNQLLSKATKELSVRKDLELEILETQRLIKTESEAIAANLTLQSQIEQLRVDVMDEGLEKTRAQIELNEKIAIQKLNTLEDEMLAQNDIFELANKNRANMSAEDIKALDAGIAANKKQAENIAEARILIGTKATNDINKVYDDGNKAASKNEVKGAKKTAEEILEIKKKLADETLDLQIQNAKDGSQEELDLQKKSLNKQAEDRKAATKKLLDEEIITKEDYAENIAEINENTRQSELELEKEYIRKRADLLINSTQTLADGLLQINSNLVEARIEQDTIDMDKRIERHQSESDNKYESDKLYIEKSVGNERERDIQLQELAIKKKQEDDRLATEQRAQEKAMRERAFKADQNAAIAQIAIQTAIAAAKSLAQGGWPGGLLLMAGAIATGAIQLGIVKSQKLPQYGKGGMVDGKSHQQGGALVELEGGEGILTKKAMQDPILRAQASEINVKGGGVAFGETGYNMKGRPNIPTSILDFAIHSRIPKAEFGGMVYPNPSIFQSPSNDYINTNNSIESSMIQDIVSQVVGQVISIPVVVQERDVTQTQRVVSTYQSQSKF